MTVEEEKNDKGEGQKYIIKPGKEDFKKFIELGHFRECTSYKKIVPGSR